MSIFLESHLRMKFQVIVGCILMGVTQVLSSPTCDVILLHGLARSSSAMEDIADSLSRKGYKTYNLDYPSTEYPLESLAVLTSQQIQNLKIKKPLCFVTHSMGGILYRLMRQKGQLAPVQRVVMIGPPNQGSTVPDSVGHTWYFRWWNGPAGEQLRTGPQGIAARLGPAQDPVGVIAGNEYRFWDAAWNRRFGNQAHDGKVSVEQTKLQGMADHLILPVAHTFMPNDTQVIAQTLYFLKNGVFFRPQS
jgi:triacylglycerol lipase